MYLKQSNAYAQLQAKQKSSFETEEKDERGSQEADQSCTNDQAREGSKEEEWLG